MEGVLSKSDLSCSASESNKDLEGCIQRDEKLISSMVDVIHLKSNGTKFEVPIQVFVPCNKPDDTLEVILKVSTGKGTWNIPDTLPHTTFKETPNVSYVGIELASLQHVKLVACSRFKREKIVVDKNGRTYESDKDRNIKVLFPPDTFHDPTKVSMKVLPLKGRYLQSAKKFHKSLGSIGSPSSLYEIDCANDTVGDILMELYGQGSDEEKEIYIGSEKLHKRPQKPKVEVTDLEDGEEAEEGAGDDFQTGSDSMDDMYWAVLKRCESTLVTELLVNDVLNYLKRSDTLALSNSKIESVTSQKCRGDQVREFIKQLSFLGPHAFEAFVDSLTKTGQSSLAELITKTLKEEETRDKSSLARGNLHVVYRQCGGAWSVMEHMDVIQDSGGVLVKLPSNNKVYEVIAVTSPPTMSTDEICKAAESLCNHTNETKAAVICRQKGANLQDVYIHCVKSEEAKTRIKELQDMGYTEGPAESAEFCILDGEDIHITFALNIRFNCLLGHDATIKFYSYMDSARLSGNLEVIDERAQSRDKMFHGNMVYSIGSRPKIVPYTGSVAVYLPKPELTSDRPYFAPLTLNVPVQAVAKFLAFRFTSDPQLQSKWTDFTKNLENNPSKLRKIQTRVNTEFKDQLDRIKYEKFILNWAKERPVAEDKILFINQTLGKAGMRNVQTENKEFADIYRDGGLLSDGSLKQMVEHIEDHWEMLSINLGVAEDHRRRIKIDYDQNQARALVMLDLWRLSEKAIENGKHNISFLLKACKDANCPQSLLKRIQQCV